MAIGNGIVEYPTTGTTSDPVQAVAGPDGNLWVTEYAAKEVIAISPTGTIAKTVHRVAVPVWDRRRGQRPALVHRERDHSLIGTVSSAWPRDVDGVSAPGRGADPQGIAIGPDGNVWFTE